MIEGEDPAGPVEVAAFPSIAEARAAAAALEVEGIPTVVRTTASLSAFPHAADAFAGAALWVAQPQAERARKLLRAAAGGEEPAPADPVPEELRDAEPIDDSLRTSLRPSFLPGVRALLWLVAAVAVVWYVVSVILSMTEPARRAACRAQAEPPDAAQGHPDPSWVPRRGKDPRCR